MEDTRIIKCFIGSPGDTTVERGLCDKVIKEINESRGQFEGFRLETLKWEDNTHPAIGRDGQDVINGQIGLDYDIFIGIMFKKFGTATLRAGSGTEEEFDRALSLHKRNKDVQIMFYFNIQSVKLDEINVEDLAKVNEFKKKVRGKGKKEGCFTWDYDGPTDFETQLRRHLNLYISQKLKRTPYT